MAWNTIRQWRVQPQRKYVERPCVATPLPVHMLLKMVLKGGGKGPSGNTQSYCKKGGKKTMWHFSVCRHRPPSNIVVCDIRKQMGFSRECDRTRLYLLKSWKQFTRPYFSWNLWNTCMWLVSGLQVWLDFCIVTGDHASCQLCWQFCL